MQDVVTVMIADDEAAIRNGLEDIVSGDSPGIQVVAAAQNGEEALAYIKQYRPDIAIIDINMPVYDGLEVIRLAAQSKVETRFLILSGYNDFSYAQTAIQYGVKNYFLKPLNIKEFKTALHKHCDEIRLIQSAKNHLTPQKLTSLVRSSRIYSLNQLISGRMRKEEDIRHKIRELQIPLSMDQPVCVTVFRFSGIGDTSPTLLSRISQGIIKKSFHSYKMESWIYDDSHILSVFHVDDIKDPCFRHTLHNCMSDIRNMTDIRNMPDIRNMSHGESLRVSAGIGSVVPALEMVHQSYRQALDALAYQIYDGEGGVYDPTMICCKKPAFSRENIDTKPLIYYITHSNIQGIREYMDTFFQSLFFIEMPPPNFITGMCMYLMMNVQKQVDLLYPDQKPNMEFTWQEINELSSIHTMKQWTADFFIRYSELLKENSCQDNSIIKASKEYIRDHLHQNIRAKDVAAHINLSESYFSIYFKEKTGTNFRDYILTARIELAKKLLLSQELPISEIAYLTGYQDYRSFSRAFKNETGMAPSEYHPAGNRHERI